MLSKAHFPIRSEPAFVPNEAPEHFCFMFVRNLVNSLAKNMSVPTKLSKCTPYIGTHDNAFHCDDVTACHILKSLERFQDHEIVRTRDQKLLDGADIVVDVGGELDVDRLRLDHHQRSFDQTIKNYHPHMKTTNPNKAVRLSSAGLVYAIFGKDYIVKQLNLGETYTDIKGDTNKREMIDTIYGVIYLAFMEEVDAIDNGVEIADGDNLVYNYRFTSDLSSRVGYLNPIGKEVTPEMRLEQFKKAMDLVGSELVDRIKFYAGTWWPNRQALRECVLKREDFDPSGQMVLVESTQLVGWRSSLVELEQELDIVGKLKFIVFYDGSDASPWRATAVTEAGKSFQSRVPLLEQWRGKRDEELQQISGIPDATFVHMSGFTGGAKSMEGVKRMVRKTLGLE